MNANETQEKGIKYCEAHGGKLSCEIWKNGKYITCPLKNHCCIDEEGRFRRFRCTWDDSFEEFSKDFNLMISEIYGKG